VAFYGGKTPPDPPPGFATSLNFLIQPFEVKLVSLKFKGAGIFGS